MIEYEIGGSKEERGKLYAKRFAIVGVIELSNAEEISKFVIGLKRLRLNK